MLTEEIIDLLIKKRLESLNDQEQIKLDAWIKENSAAEFMKSMNSLNTALEHYEIFQYYNQECFKKKLYERRNKIGKKINIRKLFKYAAILLLPIIMAVSLNYVWDNPYFQKPILPGSEIAVMDLPNGESVNLKSNIAKIHKNNGKEVIIPKIDLLNYLAQSKDFNDVNYSTIRVPRGGFYFVILSDGSTVWLNSNSSMRFPLKFSGSERRVWIEGEAYFSIAKDTIPFIVSCNCQEIKVLGTSFNVTAYPEDQQVTTALLSGSIMLTPYNSGSSFLLMPGDCATTDRGDLSVKQYSDDVQLYSLWKEGVFKFREKSMSEIVSVLQRWYDFEVVYESESVKNMRFNAIALKNNPLDDVFRLLQMTTSISYKRRGNVVYLSN